MAPLKGELSAKLTEGFSPKGPTTYVQSLKSYVLKTSPASDAK